MNIYAKKQQWKRLLFVFAALIGIASLLYTDNLVKKLAEEERKKVELWAKGTKMLANLQDENIDISFVFEVIRNNVTVPVILSDEQDNIISYRNLDSAKSLVPAYLQKEIEIMKSQNEPIEVLLANDKKNFIYYKNSQLLTQLRWYPYIQLGIISLFVLVSYFAFSTSRKAEQDQVWVGMAKETAHQLGTPLSSLMAWVEYLKMKDISPEIISDIEKDIRRLEIITERFSKIGSTPKLENENLKEAIEESINYIKLRTSKKVIFDVNYSTADELLVPVNPPLFAWVVENLCRNGIDAMNGNGQIGIHVSEVKNEIVIDVSDTGKGIEKSKFKDVFQPGYTTKKRGWGLGLSLSKRIIENYHDGKIFVKNSEIDKGTTFRIILNKENPNA